MFTGYLHVLGIDIALVPAVAGHSITQLKITHDEFDGGANISTAVMGWTAILNNLKTLLEMGKTLSYAWRG